MAKRIPLLWTLTGILMVVSGVLIFAAYSFLLNRNAPQDGDYHTYQYHIAIISDEKDNAYWQDIYQGAKEAGAQYGAYVEEMDSGLVNAFSMEDAINVAIYAGVDGILLRPSDQGISATMIDKANEYGIPVITMQKDIPSSSRQGFVGINDYFLGQEYGKQVLKLTDEHTHLVTVLVPGSTFDETSQNWFRQGLSSTVEQSGIVFDFQIIQDDNGLNNAEDIIHSIAEEEVPQPDIIICLDETITQSTSQLVRECGLSQDIKVIGNYVSTQILQEIKDGYLDSTITIDPQAMGQVSMDALMTYIRYHMVSYYTEVDTMLIDQATATAYLEGGESDGIIASED